MNAQEYNIVKDFVQEVLGSKNIEDFMFDPLHKAHPKQDFPDLAYEIVGKVVNRFDFIDWEDVEKTDHWIWQVIGQELDKIALEESDWDSESWTESPYKE
jgi:hypothetical protein